MPDQRRCSRCGMNYESIDELHKGGHCPSCGSYLYEAAVKSDYRAKAKREDEPVPGPVSEKSEEPDDRLPGSTADYLNE